MIIVKLKGGLGNQLFQYSVGKSISLRTGQELKFDLEFFEKPIFSNVYRLDKYSINVVNATDFERKQLRNEYINPKLSKLIRKINLHCKFNKRSHLIEGFSDNIDQILLTWNSKTPCYLDGYFQYPIVFDDYKEILRQDLIPNLSLSKSIQKKLGQINAVSNSVAIHIRKGDMIKNDNFFHLQSDYFNEAIQLIKGKIKKPIFFIFTDEPKGIMNGLNLRDNYIIISNKHSEISRYSTYNDIEELFLMQHCSNYIISNSTFSWWGAYLSISRKPIVIAPSKWYQHHSLQRRFDKSNMILNNWVTI